ncbi:MAG: DUF3108 domain-containing protein [Cytophagia bacterium]|nr:MAG: DUF3108 domain-containing protein [Cytophagales bacterium]TAG06497.1 MAG: DUF3108 domain-containing protein [Cytophagia bacterium]TAG44267.1 MAG: DUF3108 domain-containing protein [Cytophagia bacterium]TAH30953.1 MAG: DUF3108 domain-containing protein [Cytophagales bacterium]
MKRNFVFGLLCLFFASFVGEGSYRFIKNDIFGKNEHIEYGVSFGFLNAGVATVDVSPKHFLLNNRICYKIDVAGRTTGIGGGIVRVQDTWRTYLDTAAFVCHRSFRHIEEGSYRREELTDFKPLTNKGIMKFEEYGEKDPISKRKKGKKEFKIPDNVQDMVSGYYYLRTLNFDKMQIGEVVMISGMLEDKSYDLKIKYKGKDIIKTKFGKIHAHKIVPIMPDNQMFSGENSVRFWVSDDKNRVPVRVEADMFIGKIVVELKDYANLKHKFNFKQ